MTDAVTQEDVGGDPVLPAEPAPFLPPAAGITCDTCPAFDPGPHEEWAKLPDPFWGLCRLRVPRPRYDYHKGAVFPMQSAVRGWRDKCGAHPLLRALMRTGEVHEGGEDDGQ